jgi:hypothetical protein
VSASKTRSKKDNGDERASTPDAAAPYSRPAVLDAGAVGIRRRRFLGWMTKPNQPPKPKLAEPRSVSDSAVVLAGPGAG